MLRNIDRELAPMKAHYFLYNAATGPIVQFLPIIARQIGFSAASVGTIYSILPLSGLLSKPVFGVIADKFKIHKFLLLFFQVMLTVCFFSISHIPKLDISANVTLICDKNIPYLEICPKRQFSDETLLAVIMEHTHITSVCYLSCTKPSHGYIQLSGKNISMDNSFKLSTEFDMYQDLIVKNCVDVRIHTFIDDTTVQVPNCGNDMRTWCKATCKNDSRFNHLLQEAKRTHVESDLYLLLFHLFLALSIMGWVGLTVVVSITDAICFDLLGYERRKDYGKQKMWSSIGFGIFGISAGYLVDVFSKGESEKNYNCIFYILLIMMIFDFTVSVILKKKNPECNGGVMESSVLWELSTIMKEGRILVFSWWCIGVGMCTGVVWNFLFWYTEDLAIAYQVVWLKTLQGLLTGVQCFLGELPFNFLSGIVLKKFGRINVMSLVLLIYAIRFMIYSFISNPWLFLIIELLHGPSFGLCWPTMVSYGDQITPFGTKATVQGFIGAVFEGIGVSSGSFICGLLISTYGSVNAFRAFSAGALLWLIGFWLMELLLRKLKAHPIHQGHNHLANYTNPDDAILMTISQELQTY